ncbi:MAG: helix-turn-helix domain-containing protein [Desulfovibrio sp.]|uniref:helix-turn-helix domain-containing protein n=1 Tax=Desulfovibrio sp. TaxID=885 RepID=UPI0025B95352|nr:helix-turn-helix domain-containing protein [Desulfovibrio sp.]MBS6830092.1 helix-turn-helix domain-containing protein [Desulfovibrio sp.]
MRAPKQITVADQDIDLEKAIANALEKILAPVVEVICEMERIRRKEYLTEKEAALLFSLSAATLKTQRSRGEGAPFIRLGSRVLYSRKSFIAFLYHARGGRETEKN